MNTEDDDSSFCPVCKERFTDATKIPACLKCGHVLCRPCAFTIMRNPEALCRVCPICRSPGTCADVRVIYVGNVRPLNERGSLEMKNEQLRNRLRSTQKEFEKSSRMLRWFEEEHLPKCNLRLRMLSYHQRNSGYLYRQMQYYRGNWYRLKNNFERMKVQKNAELSFLRNRLRLLSGRVSLQRRKQSYNVRVSPL